MIMRTLISSAALATCLLTLMPAQAQAKKVKFKVHNCTDRAFKVHVYDGDDGVSMVERARHRFEANHAGQERQLSCRVDSGKRRCFIEFSDAAGKPSKGKADRVRHKRTYYITKVAISPSKIYVTHNTTGCPAAPEPAATPTKPVERPTKPVDPGKPTR